MGKEVLISVEERQKRRLAKWVSTLTVDSEFVGLFGISHKDSFYKIYVRQNKTEKRWWKFDAAGVPANLDPIKHQKGLSKENHTESVHGKLTDLSKYKIHPGKKGLEAILSRAKALNTN